MALPAEAYLPVPPKIPAIPPEAAEQRASLDAAVERLFRERCVWPTVAEESSPTNPKIWGPTRTATWMGDLGTDLIGHLPFSQLKFVGTHNSGTSSMGRDLSKGSSSIFLAADGPSASHSPQTAASLSSSIRFSSGSSGGPTVLSGDGTAAIARLPWGIRHIGTAVTKPWAKTQGLSIYEQLEAGYRYMDLRLITNEAPWRAGTSGNGGCGLLQGSSSSNANDDSDGEGVGGIDESGNFDVGELWVAHGLFSVPHRRVVNEALAFARRYPKEVFVLDYNRLLEMDEAMTDEHAMGADEGRAERRHAARRRLLFGDDKTVLGSGNGSNQPPLPAECMRRQRLARRFARQKRREFVAAATVQPCTRQRERHQTPSSSSSAVQHSNNGSPVGSDLIPLSGATSNAGLTSSSYASAVQRHNSRYLRTSNYHRESASPSSPIAVSSSETAAECPYGVALAHNALFEDAAFGCCACPKETALRRFVRDLHPLLPHIIPSALRVPLPPATAVAVACGAEEGGETEGTAAPEGATTSTDSRSSATSASSTTSTCFVSPANATMAQLWALPPTRFVNSLRIASSHSGNNCIVGRSVGEAAEEEEEAIRPSIIVTFPRHLDEYLRSALFATTPATHAHTHTEGNTNSDGHRASAGGGDCDSIRRDFVVAAPHPTTMSSTPPPPPPTGGRSPFHGTEPRDVGSEGVQNPMGGDGGGRQQQYAVGRSLASPPSVFDVVARGGGIEAVGAAATAAAADFMRSMVGLVTAGVAALGAAATGGVVGEPEGDNNGSPHHKQQTAAREAHLDQEWHNRRTPALLLRRMRWYLCDLMATELVAMVAESENRGNNTTAAATANASVKAATEKTASPPPPPPRRIFVTGAIITIGAQDVVRGLLTGCCRGLASPALWCLNRPKYNPNAVAAECARQMRVTDNDDDAFALPVSDASAATRRGQYGGCGDGSSAGSAKRRSTSSANKNRAPNNKRSFPSPSSCSEEDRRVASAAEISLPLIEGGGGGPAPATPPPQPRANLPLNCVPTTQQSEERPTSAMGVSVGQSGGQLKGQSYFLEPVACCDARASGGDAASNLALPYGPSAADPSFCGAHCGGSIFHVAREINAPACLFFYGMNTAHSRERWEALTTAALFALARIASSSSSSTCRAAADICRCTEAARPITSSTSALLPFSPRDFEEWLRATGGKVTYRRDSGSEDALNSAAVCKSVRAASLLRRIVYSHWGTLCACGRGESQQPRPSSQREGTTTISVDVGCLVQTQPLPNPLCLWCICNHDRNVLQLDYAEDATIEMAMRPLSPSGTASSAAEVRWEETAVEMCIRRTIAFALSTLKGENY